jgi:hypothetical protein
MDSPGTWERPPPFSQAENVKRVAPVEGDRRRSAKEAEEAYEPVVPTRTGNCGLRCRRTRRREAGNKTTHRSKETSRDTELGERMSTELERISKLAGENRQLKFLSIAHLLTPEALMEAFKSDFGTIDRVLPSFWCMRRGGLRIGASPLLITVSRCSCGKCREKRLLLELIDPHIWQGISALQHKLGQLWPW